MDSDIVSPYSPRIGEFRRRLSKEKELIQSYRDWLMAKLNLQLGWFQIVSPEKENFTWTS